MNELLLGEQVSGGERRELHSLARARPKAPSPIVDLLITAAELRVRADLGVVDAAEETFAREPAWRPGTGARRAATADQDGPASRAKSG